MLSCLLKAPVRRGDGAGLESAEAGSCAVSGCAAGLHRPHQLLPGLHPGPHTGSCGCLRHTPRTKVIHLDRLFGCCSSVLPLVSQSKTILSSSLLPPLPPPLLSLGFYQPSSWSSSAQPARSSFLSFSSKSCRKCLSASRKVGCSTCQSFHRASWTTPCTALWFTHS